MKLKAIPGFLMPKPTAKTIDGTMAKSPITEEIRSCNRLGIKKTIASAEPIAMGVARTSASSVVSTVPTTRESTPYDWP